jgi:hypothetical protein
LEHQSVKLLEIQPEIYFFVVTNQIDGEYLVAGKVSGELRGRLLSRSTETDKKTATFLETDYTMDLGHVIQRVVEEHQVHGHVLEVVFFKDLVHLLSHLIISTQILIQPWIFSLFEGWVTLSIISENQRVAHNVLLHVVEEAFDQVGDEFLCDQINISLRDKPISEDSGALVSPQSDKTGFVGDLVESGLVHAFVDRGHVTQVEDVVELQGSTGQFL